jgi:hypothetical protein
VLSAVIDVQLIPGVPVGALGVVCPAASAAILSYRERGAAGAVRLLARSVDVRRIRAKVWLVPALVLAPAITIGTYALAHWRGSPVGAPHLTILPILVMAVVWFVFALGEELGWSGYVIDPLQRRWGALPASIVLGLFWCLVHVPLQAQLGMSPIWIAWGFVDGVATRIIMVWLYNNTGRSVFAVAAFHALLNLSGHTLFPGVVPYDAQQIRSLFMVIIATVVTVRRGARTLTRLRGRPGA